MGKHELDGRGGPRKRHRALKVILGIIIAIVAIVAAFLITITATEYKPADVEEVAVEGTTAPGAALAAGEELTIMSWNTGYSALDESADFFMDGGEHVMTATEEQVRENLASMAATITGIEPDLLFLQEVDVDSKRSHGIDETAGFASAFESAGLAYGRSFAYNFNSLFIPYPWPPMGHVESGIMTFSSFPATSASRVKLPCPFSWPVSTLNLKRCLLVSRIPVTDAEGTDTGRELVLVNLHLEAYDSGEGKVEQTKMLREVMEREVAAGNYVIAGGDFNQTFSNVDTSAYPVEEGHWQAGDIDVADFPEEFSFLMDARTPTCRSLATPYAGADPDDFVYYMIDGFIVSDNVKVKSLETRDLGFAWTDHNPVVMTFELE